MSMLQDRKVYLEGQLAVVKPNTPPPNAAAAEQVLTPEDRLRALQAQYATSSAKYGADHPDIRRLQREIAALKAEVGTSAGSETGQSEQAIRHSGVEANQRPDNPTYIALASQLENTKRELVSLAALKEDLRAKQRAYDARLLQIPEIEREYRDLTRDYDNAQTRYREVKAKQMQAAVAMELERDRKAERFTLSEEPNLPERPISPDRPRIVLGGLVASLGAGLGLAWLRDLFDRSVKGPWTLARVAPVPVLTPIPYIETEGERRRNRRRAWIIGCIAVLIALGFLVGIHLFLRALPDVWEAVTRRIGIW